MPELDLVLLGKRIRDARKKCGLTQKELAAQTGLAVKTVQDIEKGRKNPTYETLARLMERLGVSPDAAFHSETIAPTEEMKDFLEYFQSCNPRGQEILLKTLHFLAEQLRPTQDEPD